MIHESLKKLVTWIERNGWHGYDPYSIQENKFFLWLKRWPRKFPFKHIRYPFYRSIRYFPNFWIRLIKPPKIIIPKGLGLMATAYLNYWTISHDDNHFQKGVEILTWLEAHPSLGYAGLCWGYPFDWQSYRFVPKYTPSGVVTQAVGQAFLKAYHVTGKKHYLDICKSICEFMTNDLVQSRIRQDELCFSYTPLGPDHVHNANLFVAQFLVQIGSMVNNKEWIHLGRYATNYTIRRIQESGAFWYFGQESRMLDIPVPERAITTIDNYHTGFVLRSLFHINKIFNDSLIRESLDKAINFYLRNFFIQDGEPPLKYHYNCIWPVDIHSCSETLLVLNLLQNNGWNVGKDLERIFNWTIRNMQDKKGYFYYQKHKIITAKIPYIRWGQAWMFYTLVQLLINNGES